MRVSEHNGLEMWYGIYYVQPVNHKLHADIHMYTELVCVVVRSWQTIISWMLQSSILYLPTSFIWESAKFNYRQYFWLYCTRENKTRVKLYN